MIPKWDFRVSALFARIDQAVEYMNGVGRSNWEEKGGRGIVYEYHSSTNIYTSFMCKLGIIANGMCLTFQNIAE